MEGMQQQFSSVVFPLFRGVLASIGGASIAGAKVMWCMEPFSKKALLNLSKITVLPDCWV